MSLLWISSALTICLTTLAFDQQSILFNTSASENCFDIVRIFDICHYISCHTVSFKDVVNYCKHKHPSSAIITDLTVAHRTAILSLDTSDIYRILFGLLLDFSSATYVVTDDVVLYKVPLIYENGTVHSEATVSLSPYSGVRTILLGSSNTSLTIINSEWKQDLETNMYRIFCLMIHVSNVYNISDSKVQIVQCDNIRKWDYAMCVHSDANCCYQLKSKECIPALHGANCFWRYSFKIINANLVPKDAVCLKRWSDFARVRCDCIQCTYTQWTSWTVFYDSSGYAVATRYRPLDINPRWNCSALSDSCCVEFKILSSDSELDFDPEYVANLIECQHGGVRDYEDGSCQCKDSAHGIWCEINLNKCQSQPCRNQTTCLDSLYGHECLCSDATSGGENCEEKTIIDSLFNFKQMSSEHRARWILIYISIALPGVAFIVLLLRQLPNVYVYFNSKRNGNKMTSSRYSLTDDKSISSNENSDDLWDPMVQWKLQKGSTSDKQASHASSGSQPNENAKKATGAVNAIK